MSFENPLSILFNTEGNELAVTDKQVLTGSGIQPGIIVAGSSSTGDVHFMRVATDGAVFITGSVTATATMASNTPVSQGNPGGIPDSWYVRITDGSQVLGTGSSAPLWVTGSTTVQGSVTANVTGTVGLDRGDSTSNPLFVSGAVTVAGTVTANVTGTVGLDRGDSTSNPLFVSGAITTTFDPSTSATVTEVSSSATTVTLQAANGSRRGLLVFNESTKNLYVKLGAGATSTSFSVKLSARGYFEVPGNYTGIVTGVWDAANGSAWVTEILD